MNVDVFTSYLILLLALAGLHYQVVMMPETYEEAPIKDLGKLLTQAIIDER